MDVPILATLAASPTGIISPLPWFAWRTASIRMAQPSRGMDNANPADFRGTRMASLLRIGIVGAGGNTRLRHIPGFRAITGVEIAAVCNRRPESTAAAAREFDVPRTYDH